MEQSANTGENLENFLSLFRIEKYFCCSSGEKIMMGIRAVDINE